MPNTAYTRVQKAAAGDDLIALGDALKADASTINALTGDDGYAPMHYAAKNGNQEMVKLLRQHHARINVASNLDDWTPLHLAIEHGHEALALDLLENHALHDVPTREGLTPLHLAAKKGLVQVMRVLLDKGAKPNALADGHTPLQLAAEAQKSAAVELLLSKGASLALAHAYATCNGNHAVGVRLGEIAGRRVAAALG